MTTTTDGRIETIAGYLLIASALPAWYTASGMTRAGTFERPAFPLGRGDIRRPGTVAQVPAPYDVGGPCADVGQ